MSGTLAVVARTCDSVPGPRGQAAIVTLFIAACWPGMSRAQLLDRARRLGLHGSLRLRPESGQDGIRLYASANACEHVFIEVRGGRDPEQGHPELVNKELPKTIAALETELRALIGDKPA